MSWRLLNACLAPFNSSRPRPSAQRALVCPFLSGMLLGFHDDGSDASDDDLPVAMEVLSVWQPGRQRHSVASACSARLPNLVGLDEDYRDAPAQSVIEWPAEVSCPVERLLRMALLVNAPEQYAPAPSRKRRRNKQTPELGELLAAVIASPGADPAPHFKAPDRKHGYDEFERRFAGDLSQPIRAVRSRARQLWTQASRGVQNGWTVLARVCKRMYVRTGARTRELQPVPGQAGTAAVDGLVVENFDVNCLGVLCTWMLDLGLEDPGVLAAVASGQSGEQLLQTLTALPLYRRAFLSFQEWVEHKADSMGFQSHAASMELCLHGTLRHRVHVHAFLGPRLDMMAWEQRHLVISLDVATMGWGGVRPHLRFLRPKRAGGSVRSEVVGGIYYVLMDKPGTMFRAGNRWPFVDL